MKHLILVTLLALFALNNVNAQGAKVTINGLSAVVTIEMSVDKALKTAINAGIQSRATCELHVVQGSTTTVFLSEYKNGTYFLVQYDDDDKIGETYSSTRVSDVRLQIAKLLGMS